MTGVQKQLIAPLAVVVGWQGGAAGGGDATPICRAGEALLQLERAAVGALNNAAPAQVAIGILKALSAHLRQGYRYSMVFNSSKNHVRYSYKNTKIWFGFFLKSSNIVTQIIRFKERKNVKFKNSSIFTTVLRGNSYNF